MALVDRAQSEAYRIDRFLAAKTIMTAITAEDLQEVARRYLTPAGAVEVLALPDGVVAK